MHRALIDHASVDDWKEKEWTLKKSHLGRFSVDCTCDGNAECRMQCTRHMHGNGSICAYVAVHPRR